MDISILYNRCNILLLMGGFLLIMAVIQAYTGRALTRNWGIYYRDKDPKRFWWAVGMNALVGTFFIGFSLYLSQ